MAGVFLLNSKDKTPCLKMATKLGWSGGSLLTPPCPWPYGASEVMGWEWRYFVLVSSHKAGDSLPIPASKREDIYFPASERAAWVP